MSNTTTYPTLATAVHYLLSDLAAPGARWIRGPVSGWMEVFADDIRRPTGRTATIARDARKRYAISVIKNS